LQLEQNMITCLARDFAGRNRAESTSMRSMAVRWFISRQPF